MVRVFTLALMLEVLRLSSFLAKLGPHLGWEHHLKKKITVLPAVGECGLPWKSLLIKTFPRSNQNLLYLGP